jgi:hypothetical protein
MVGCVRTNPARKKSLTYWLLLPVIWVMLKATFQQTGVLVLLITPLSSFAQSYCMLPVIERRGICSIIARLLSCRRFWASSDKTMLTISKLAAPSVTPQSTKEQALPRNKMPLNW